MAAPVDIGNNLGSIPNYNKGNPASYINNATYKYTAFSLLIGYTYHMK